jgi:hypothetical protein
MPCACSYYGCKDLKHKFAQGVERSLVSPRALRNSIKNPVVRFRKYPGCLILLECARTRPPAFEQLGLEISVTGERRTYHTVRVCQGIKIISKQKLKSRHELSDTYCCRCTACIAYLTLLSVSAQSLAAPCPGSGDSNFEASGSGAESPITTNKMGSAVGKCTETLP